MKTAVRSAVYSFSLRDRIDRSHQLLREAHRLFGQTATLHTEMSRLVGESASGIRRSRCLAPRRISGGDDAGLITAILAGGAATCVDCIAKKAGIPHVDIPSIMANISTFVQVETLDLRCSVCLTTRKVYRFVVGGADGPKTLVEMMTTRILRFLHEHPSRVFCAHCISQTLFNGRDIDVAMRHAEARGIKRHHSECSECGKPRLVAGVVAN